MSLLGTDDDDFPSLLEWFAQAPTGRIFLFAVASLCTLITNFLGWKLIYQHVKAGNKEAEVVVFFPEIRKKVLYQIFWLNFLSGTAYCGLLLPRTSLFLEFLMAAYEAWALLGFMRMLIDLMGGRLQMLKILQEQPPKKLFSVMPCCCLVFVDVPRRMTANIMAICRLGANQAAIVRPLLAAINLFIQLNGGYQLWASSSVYVVIDVLELVSKMTSVFFIFVLYGSSQNVLKRYNVGHKFILLRLMFLPFIVQSFFISFVFLFLPPNEDAIFPPAVAALSWSNTLTSIEVLPLAIAMFYVYPVHGEFDLDLVPPKGYRMAHNINDPSAPLLSPSQKTSSASLTDSAKERQKQFYLSLGYQSAEDLQSMWKAHGGGVDFPSTTREMRSVGCQVDEEDFC